MIDYEIGRFSPTGVRLAPIPGNEVNLDLTLKANDISLLTMVSPCCENLGFDDLIIGQRLSLCASCDCGSSFVFGDTPFFVVRREMCDDENGCSVKIVAESANTILQRRKVAYDATDGAGNANPKGQATNERADDLIKRIFRQNGGVAAQTGYYGVAVDPTRSIEAYISTEADEALAPLATYQFSGQDLLSAMRSIADISAGKGTPLYFGIYQDSCDSTALQFRTSIDYFGTDRNVIISPDNETIGSYCMSEDIRNSANRIYVTDGNQAITVSEDPLLAASLLIDPFTLRESSASTSSTEANAATDLGKAELERLSKVFSLDGTLREGKRFRYGCDYFFGDRVTAFAEGYTFSVVVDTLHFQQNGNVQVIEPSFSSQQSAINQGTGPRSLYARIKNLERQLARITARV